LEQILLDQVRSIGGIDQFGFCKQKQKVVSTAAERNEYQVGPGALPLGLSL
jgi:hypothetical protein